jgi:hypothetical protein
MMARLCMYGLCVCIHTYIHTYMVLDMRMNIVYRKEGRVKREYLTMNLFIFLHTCVHACTNIVDACLV